MPEDDKKQAEPNICTCGYEDGTFACRIRHQYLHHGWAASSH